MSRSMPKKTNMSRSINNKYYNHKTIEKYFQTKDSWWSQIFLGLKIIESNKGNHLCQIGNTILSC